ncbi:MAG: NmrA family NAD(P)-binding protein [Nocardiopsis sp. BM-2018]|nr:MAG: NmrA family NAD(P)-binding protein [Nocardiopsis sp. BM-2018]
MSTDQNTAPVLVTGATGRQGGATARALLALGVPVRALVRDPGSERAKAVEALGAELVKGDLYDVGSVREAARGVRAVFSVQMPDMNNIEGDSEWVFGSNLVRAAQEAGVSQFVHTSVSGAGTHRDAPGWAEGRWKAVEHYYETKFGLEELVRGAGFEHWTVLRPGFFMENFDRSEGFMLTPGPEPRMLTVLRPDTVLAMVAVEDIGAAAAAAITDPERFHQVILELSGDRLPMSEVAGVLSSALGVELAAPSMGAEEALAAGMFAPLAAAHEYMNQVDTPARPEFAHALGIPTTSFAAWAGEHMRPTGL